MNNAATMTFRPHFLDFHQNNRYFNNFNYNPADNMEVECVVCDELRREIAILKNELKLSVIEISRLRKKLKPKPKRRF
jgi:hypothetical protein